MTTKPNGGPTFPIVSGDDVLSDGMTLRQYYAGQALMGIANTISPSDLRSLADGITGGKLIARAAFQIADAMIEAEKETS
jgi:hypothetical protein